MPGAIRNNGLSIFFGLAFFLALGGQAIAGHNQYNEGQIEHAQLLHEQPQEISLGRYVTSSDFGRDVMENWQSEFLQFFLFIAVTVWLVQRGSPESKPLDRAGGESETEQKIGRHPARDSPWLARRGGIVTALYSNSLLILMALIFLGSWLVQSVAGWSAFNADQADHMQPAVSWIHYLGTSDFWDRTLQNWQSEFLAVGAMAVFSIYLRQRGSPESKPVGAAHEATGIES
jgi:hypothetical protein